MQPGTASSLLVAHDMTRDWDEHKHAAMAVQGSARLPDGAQVANGAAPTRLSRSVSC